MTETLTLGQLENEATSACCMCGADTPRVYPAGYPALDMCSSCEAQSIAYAELIEESIIARARGDVH